MAGDTVAAVTHTPARSARGIRRHTRLTDGFSSKVGSPVHTVSLPA
ncbi:MAG: hypothetical protein Q8Q29_09280 [Actinomycetota bacterium]|nr:hypothetical protein [Actinomycetota bacterium]